MLELKDVHTFYGESHILNGVSLNIPEASVVSLLGRNGMGKTTTVRSIVGFTPPRSGMIRFKNKEIQNFSSHKIALMGMGLVPQGRRIFPSLSVYENLTLGLRGKGWDVKRIYNLFPILKVRAKHRGNQLSGGEQQMLAIARALLTNPELILMDEPSEGLAPILVQEVGKIISKLKQEGISILLVEQNLSLALSVSDYIYIISKGEIVYNSSSAELQNNEEVKMKHLGITE